MLMEKERNLIVEYGKKLITENLTSGTGGNISIYDPEQGLFAISPSGIDYFETRPEDVVVMNLDGEIVEGDRKPSSEKDLHIGDEFKLAFIPEGKEAGQDFFLD